MYVLPGIAREKKQWLRLNSVYSSGLTATKYLLMANKYVKRCLPSFIIRDMQIKTTMRNHLIPVRMTIIRKSTKNKCWRGCPLLVGM